MFGDRNKRFPRKCKSKISRRLTRNYRFKDFDEEPGGGQDLSTDSGSQSQKSSKIPPFCCKFCPASINSLKELRQHNLKHLPNDSFLCYKCLAVFHYQDKLNRHLMRHNLSINFQCNSCELQFLTMNELVKHCDVKKHDFNDVSTMDVETVPSKILLTSLSLMVLSMSINQVRIATVSFYSQLLQRCGAETLEEITKHGVI
uniref:C2H2-type domain-containing protein n=1 Tax=Glossina brevipalpis TaxID=37001 RepID=A0A1A9W5D8_9MUSC